MKVILAAVDGSPRARGVVQAAAALAERCDASVVLVRALTLHPDLPPAAMALTPDQVADLVAANALEALRELELGIPEKRRRGVRAGFGAPCDIVDRFVAAEDADLIVIGAHGYGGFDRMLGTTAAKIVNHATRAVLVVRDVARLTRGARAIGGSRADAQEGERSHA
jgi:universal stress protein F